MSDDKVEVTKAGAFKRGAQYKLSSVPTKDELLTAFRDMRETIFAIEADENGVPRELHVMLNEIGHEDGSGKSHLFEGHVRGAQTLLFKGWFRTDRTGSDFFIELA